MCKAVTQPSLCVRLDLSHCISRSISVVFDWGHVAGRLIFGDTFISGEDRCDRLEIPTALMLGYAARPEAGEVRYTW